MPLDLEALLYMVAKKPMLKIMDAHFCECTYVCIHVCIFPACFINDLSAYEIRKIANIRNKGKKSRNT